MTKIGFNTRTEARAEAERIANLYGMQVVLARADYKGVEWEDESCDGEGLAYYVGHGEAFHRGDVLVLGEYENMIAWAHDDTIEE